MQEGQNFSAAYSAAHYARRWSGHRAPGRDAAGEHQRLEQAALARDADSAVAVLVQHLTTTAAVLSGDTHDEPLETP